MDLDKAEFLWNRLVFHLKISNNVLHLKCVKKLNPLNPKLLENISKSIPLLNILSIEHESGYWKINTKVKSLQLCGVKHLFSNTESPCKVLTVSAYITTDNKTKQRKIQTFKLQTFTDRDDAAVWCSILQSELKNALSNEKILRPKTLLVFVNPIGGRKNALSVYENIASPVFKLAGVKITQVVTKQRDHAKEYVQTVNLSEFDGIVAVGGDGMANEIINGVLMAAQREKNISLDGDMETLCKSPPNYLPSPIKLGLIPAGSTNCLSYVTQGNDDPQTSAIQIVCGEHHPLDLCSIHNDLGNFIRFSFSMAAYGFYGQVLRKSEQLRKLGPRRYDFAGVDVFTHMKTFESEIIYYLSSPRNPVKVADETTRCQYQCEVCSKNTAGAKSYDDKDLEKSQNLTTQDSSNSVAKKQEKTVEVKEIKRGSFMMINAAMNACFCAKCPAGLSPSAHLADGNMDLILLSCTSKTDLLRYLIAHTGKANRFDFPFVEVHRVKGFRHKAIMANGLDLAMLPNGANVNNESLRNSPESMGGHGCWNTDGEIIDNPNITVWVHSGLINLFARGVE